MPIPGPKEGQSQKDFMGQCIGMLMNEGKYPQKQCIAICYSKWSGKSDSSPIDEVMIEGRLPKLQKLLDYAEKSDGEYIEVLLDAMQEVDEFTESLKFDESLHPRGGDGKFTNSEGGGVVKTVSKIKSVFSIAKKTRDVLKNPEATIEVKSRIAKAFFNAVEIGKIAGASALGYGVVQTIMDKLPKPWDSATKKPQDQDQTKYDWSFIKKFDESEHPRANDGKFTFASGGGPSVPKSSGRQHMIGPAITVVSKAIPLIARAGPIIARAGALKTALSKVWPVLDKATSMYFAYSMAEDIANRIQEARNTPEPEVTHKKKYDWGRLLTKSEFDETKHPRASDGKFTSSGSGRQHQEGEKPPDKVVSMSEAKGKNAQKRLRDMNNKRVQEEIKKAEASGRLSDYERKEIEEINNYKKGQAKAPSNLRVVAHLAIMGVGVAAAVSLAIPHIQNGWNLAQKKANEMKRYFDSIIREEKKSTKYDWPLRRF